MIDPYFSIDWNTFCQHCTVTCQVGVLSNVWNVYVMKYETEIHIPELASLTAAQSGAPSQGRKAWYCLSQRGSREKQQ